MARIGDRPRRFRGAGSEADVWVAPGRKVDGHSAEGRAAVEDAGAVVFGAHAPEVGSGVADARRRDAARRRADAADPDPWEGTCAEP